MSIRTGKGDGGQSSYIDGTRHYKDELRFEAYGTVDELNSVLGLIRVQEITPEMDQRLHQISEWLFDMGSDLATPGSGLEGKDTYLESASTEVLTKWIAEEEAVLPPLRSFILPGGSPTAAACHLGRTVCRRAERRVVSLHRETNEAEHAVVFLNRLSDLLFLYARRVNQLAGVEDVEWRGKK